MSTKMLRKWSEKFRAKFPSATFGYSVVRIFHLDDAFSEILELEASPEEGELKSDASGKKCMLSCCKCLFE